jgi:hypothetical protein
MTQELNTTRTQGDWMSTEAVDMIGRPFKLGDSYVKACTSGRAVNLELCTITRVENGKIYGAGSKVAIRYPSRCLIVNESVAASNELVNNGTPS